MDAYEKRFLAITACQPNYYKYILLFYDIINIKVIYFSICKKVEA